MGLNLHNSKGGTTPPKSAPAPATGAPSWLKRGKAAADLGARDDARREQRKADQARLDRFRLKEGESRVITFLDGALDADGMLDIPYFEEHEVWTDRRPSHFMCVRETEECPLCAADNFAYYAGALTIIDHTGFKKRDDTVVEYERKLMIAKSQTLKKLSMAATKREGILGWTVDVSRSDSRVARVGDSFDWSQHHTPEELVLGCPDANPGTPTDYAEELPYRTAAELVALRVVEAAPAAPSGGSGEFGKPDFTKKGAPAGAPAGDDASDEIPF